MGDIRRSWGDVASKVESLGLKLKTHLEQEADPAVLERPQGQTQTAFQQLTNRVTDAFDAFGTAANDKDVHSEVVELADLLKGALVDTVNAVGAEINVIVGQIEDYAEGAAGRLGEALGSKSSTDEVLDIGFESSDDSAE